MKKKQKRISLILLVLLMSLVCAVSANAQDKKTTVPECKEHCYENVIEPATIKSDGVLFKRCTVCMAETDKSVIRKIGRLELSETEYDFSNSREYPSLQVYDADGNIIDEYWSYTVEKPSNPKNPGTYKYVVTFCGWYEGKCTLYYEIKNPVSTPVLESVASTSKGVKLIWNEVAEADYYAVYRKEGNGKWKKIGKVREGSQYYDTSAVYGKTYSYTVKGYKDINGAIVASDYDKNGLTVKVKKVSTPQAPDITVKNKKAVIKWTEVAGATKYEIYRATSKEGDYKLIYTHKKESLSYKDENVKAGTTYYYKICAYVGSKASNLSSYCKAYITLNPTSFEEKVISTPTSVTFSWKKVNDADYYVVFRKKAKTDSWKKLATVKASEELKYTDKVSTNYYYAIRSYEKLSAKKTIKSSLSEEIIVGSMGKPEITDINVNVNSREIIITSVLKNKPTKFQLYCKIGKNGKWKKVDSGYTGAILGSRLEYNPNGAVSSIVLKMNETYYYKIRGCTQRGKQVQYGPFSDVKSVKLYYNPKVSVTLPNKDYKESSFPVTIKNTGTSTLRVYSEGSELYNNYVTGEIFIISAEGAKIVNGKYVDIPAGKTAKVYFCIKPSIEDIYHTKKSNVLIKFMYNGSEYYSSYSYTNGKVFLNV